MAEPTLSTQRVAAEDVREEAASLNRAIERAARCGVQVDVESVVLQAIGEVPVTQVAVVCRAVI